MVMIIIVERRAMLKKVIILILLPSCVYFYSVTNAIYCDWLQNYSLRVGDAQTFIMNTLNFFDDRKPANSIIKTQQENNIAVRQENGKKGRLLTGHWIFYMKWEEDKNLMETKYLNFD